MEIGVYLPVYASAGTGPPDLAGLARHAEDIGLDAIWAGDHLSIGGPWVESTVALSVAAAATERIRIGFGVLLLALRHPAWTAKQVGALQLLSGNRLLLGVGVGGEHPREFRAAGVALAERGRRTDAILEALPGLLAGEPTRLPTEPGEPEVSLAPAAPMPPVWIGGRSDRAMRRAARFGRGWLAPVLLPGQVAGCVDRLAGFAGAAAVPALGTVLFVGGEPMVQYVAMTHGLTPERAAEAVVGESPHALAERLHEFDEAGAAQVVIAGFGADVLAEYELVAQARALLRT